jgi:primary-amine oxidase
MFRPTWQQWAKVWKRFRLPLLFLVTLGVICLYFAYVFWAKPPFPSHPLDPLTAEEIQSAAIAIKQKLPGKEVRFPSIALNEPEKSDVLNFKPGTPFKREIFAIAYDPSQGQVYEAIVDTKINRVTSWKDIPNAKPAFMDYETDLVDRIVTTDARWKEALKKRGITNLDEVAIEAWAPGLLTDEERKSGGRYMRALTYYKGQSWNQYGGPIEGLYIIVDLENQKISTFKDTEAIPFSKENWNYDAASFKTLRKAANPMKTTLPNGNTFKIDGNEITWQGWSFRYLVHPREGLTLYTIRYDDGKESRPILYRASLSEMVVPYGDPNPEWSFRNAFDIGEYNYGTMSNSQELGKEVPEYGILLDTTFADSNGETYEVPGIIGIFERDAGVLWKHYDYRSQRNEVRRDRQLVLTTTAAIGNYDYAINWIFQQDGTLGVTIDLQGIVLAQGTAAKTVSDDRSFGKLVAKNIIGVNHQHFFTFRLDMDVDGQANMPMEMTVQGLPVNSANPRGNAFTAIENNLPSEKSAVRDLKMSENREWAIASTTRKNALGGHSSYMLMPQGNTIFFPGGDAEIANRAGFAEHHLWVTKYKPRELYAGGDYPTQSSTQQGLPVYVSDDEPLMGEDLVVWYNLGVTHIPRPEDWPVMPAHHIGFKLMPVGFFDRNPAIDLPEPK